MARQWGAENFGDYATSLSFFQLLQQAPLLGLHLLLARDVAARPEFIHRDMATAAGLAIGIALLMALAVGATGHRRGARHGLRPRDLERIPRQVADAVLHGLRP